MGCSEKNSLFLLGKRCKDKGLRHLLQLVLVLHGCGPIPSTLHLMPRIKKPSHKNETVYQTNCKKLFAGFAFFGFIFCKSIGTQHFTFYF